VLLYAAARAQHVEEFIRPALHGGKLVICDRFVDSSLVYQGCLLGDTEAVKAVNDFATAGLRPDLTILLDVDPKVGLARVGRRGQGTAGKDERTGSQAGGADRIEQRLEEYHRSVRAAYLALAEKEPDRIKVIDTGERSIGSIEQEIHKNLAAFWPGFPGE
jgi:dTMP kinase